MMLRAILYASFVFGVIGALILLFKRMNRENVRTLKALDPWGGFKVFTRKR